MSLLHDLILITALIIAAPVALVMIGWLFCGLAIIIAGVALYLTIVYWDVTLAVIGTIGIGLAIFLGCLLLGCYAEEWVIESWQAHRRSRE